MIRREVRRPDGQALVVRPATLDDVDGLAALYDALSLDDLHCRFFSAFRPAREFLAKWVTVAERGGFALVGETKEDGRTRIVGDAGWSLLEDGSGEFGLTVAPDWRGWLGPYLLEVLVEEATARGIPNLQADILVENRRMLAVVRARGYVTVDHPDWTIVRVMIGTAERVPGWPPDDGRRRVLVEVPGGRWHAEAAAQGEGLRVIACPGPTRTPTGWCPMLRGEVCPLVEGADVVVDALPSGEASVEALRAAHAARNVRICAELPREASAAVAAVIASMSSTTGSQGGGRSLRA